MAESQADAQDKTEEATPKRLEESRTKGQVPRSKELNTTALLLTVGVGLTVLGPGLIEGVARIAKVSFTTRVTANDSGFEVWLSLRDALVESMLAIAPLLALAAVAALLAPMALGGWALSADQIGFKWDKLNPIKGIGKLFSWQGLMELTKAFAKFLLITSVALLLLWLMRERIFGLALQDPESAMSDTVWLILFAGIVLSAATALISALDVPFQLWNHARQLRMTRQEVKDEMRDTEGKPEVKGRIRQLQREIANRRMMEAVPEADVVITNPTHYAVALKYSADDMRAPVVLAKGAGHVAGRIRQRATDSGVPLLGAPALARAVYHSTEIGREIPAGLYTAVAQVLAYVYRVADEHRGPELPPLAVDPPIPDDLRVDE